MRVLFADCETTGKIDWKADNDAPQQPRIVQLGAILAAGPTEPLCRLELIIKPEGWTIPEEAAAIHGITTEIAASKGVPITAAMRIFGELCTIADTIVAYNADFDIRMLNIEADRNVTWRPWIKLQVVDPMHICTSICQLPGNYGDYKWPKLKEAYEKVIGKPLAQTHTALSDVRATATLFYKLLEDGLIPKPKP